jgi:hypothetical protein
MKTTVDFMLNRIPMKNNPYPLHRAVLLNARKDVEHHFQMGNNLNEQNHRGNTPLHIAIKQRFYKVARYLIQHGADCNQPNKDNITPFELACKTNDMNMIKYMIKGHHIDIEKQEKCFYYAVWNYHPHIIQYLSTSMEWPTQIMWNGMFQACIQNWEWAIRYFHRQNPSLLKHISEKTSTNLFKWNLSGWNLLEAINRYVVYTYKENSIPITHDTWKMIRILLKMGANPRWWYERHTSMPVIMYDMMYLQTFYKKDIESRKEVMKWQDVLEYYGGCL